MFVCLSLCQFPAPGQIVVISTCSVPFSSAHGFSAICIILIKVISSAGRLTLTDHALYFEELKVVTNDKAKVYDLADDLKQVIRPELTGPWGSRLFDKAVMYKSTSL